jgi:4-hydroxy-3-polyprenylbenzoate decarboxylase
MTGTLNSGKVISPEIHFVQQSFCGLFCILQLMNFPIIVGITGASGVVYAVRLVEVLLAAGKDVHVSISPSGRDVIAQELKTLVNLDRFRPADLLGEFAADVSGGLSYYHWQDFMAPMASGSFLTSGMVVCPCSGSTLAAIATGAAGNLIQRAAEVQLKERRKLILVPRETPLSLTHIDNMRRATEAGAVVLPASPGWYHGVESVRDLVDFVVARICDQLGIEQRLVKRWGARNDE